MKGYLIKLTRVEDDPEQEVPEISRVVPDIELERARGRDRLLMQYHIGDMYDKLKEAQDERKDQS